MIHVLLSFRWKKTMKRARHGWLDPVKPGWRCSKMSKRNPDEKTYVHNNSRLGRDHEQYL